MKFFNKRKDMNNENMNTVENQNETVLNTEYNAHVLNNRVTMSHKEFGSLLNILDEYDVTVEPMGDKPMEETFDDRDYKIKKTIENEDNFGRPVYTYETIAIYHNADQELGFNDELKPILGTLWLTLEILK